MAAAKLRQPLFLGEALLRVYSVWQTITKCSFLVCQASCEVAAAVSRGLSIFLIPRLAFM